MTIKAYLAARYNRREELEVIANSLRAYGIETIARWVFGEEQGLSRESIALMDIEDIDKSEMVISFTEPWDTPVVRGGRHVEFGYGLAQGKRMILIGNRENVFHWHPSVEVYANIDEFIASLI